MKNVFLALLMLSVSGAAFAQSAKVTSASNHLRYNDLDKAKAAIDGAILHSKTGAQAKTWMYKGKIYYALSNDTTAEYENIREDAIFIAADAFEWVKKHPDSRVDMAELDKYLSYFVYNKIYDDGVAYYNSKDFDNAAKHFAKSAEIRAAYDVLDTTAYFYAANASAAADKHADAIKYFSKIMNSGYEDGGIYSKMANQYKALGDTAKAMELVSAGRVQYPDNQGLLIAEFNNFVEAGKTEEAITNINQAIEANPEKTAYYLVRAKLNETRKDLVSAEADYKKILEIDPENLDANHDLGAMYVNESIVIREQMEALPYSDTKGYDAKKIELDAIFEKALPYLEKAYHLNPSDTEVQGILKKLYLRKKDMDSFNKLQQEIDAAGGDTE